MNIYPYVYRLDHPETGEFYIGFRCGNKVSAEQDLGHKYFTSSKIVKPRFHEFNYQILAEFFNKEDAYTFEQELIIENWNDIKSLNGNYTNNNKCVCIKHTNETKEKLRLSHLGKKKSSEAIEKLKISLTGHTVSEETKEKMRKVALLRPKISEETRNKLSEAGKRRKPYKHSLETIQKIKESRKSFKHDAATKRKISESMKGRPSPMKGKIPWNKGKSTSQKGIPKPKNVCRIIDKKEMALHNFMKWYNNQLS
jgi:hypothetical protein